jgi:hypothetical protein
MGTAIESVGIASAIDPAGPGPLKVYACPSTGSQDPGAFVLTCSDGEWAERDLALLHRDRGDTHDR